jgi:hypothetical protein
MDKTGSVPSASPIVNTRPGDSMPSSLASPMVFLPHPLPAGNYQEMATTQLIINCFLS